MKKNYASMAIAMACLSAAAGCHSAATPDAGVSVDGGKGSAAIPAIHAVLQWERVVNGKNVPREDYFLIMEHCKAAGWPTKELAPEEIQKLGTGKVEIWKDARGAYGRQTTWKLGTTGPSSAPDEKDVCLAELEEIIDEGDDDYTGDDWSDVAIGEVERKDGEALAKIKGFEQVGPAQVRGQPCTRWRSKDYEVCSWSGGLGMGVEDGPADSLCITQGPMAYLNPMPLESKQGSQGVGCNLQLQSMTVSKGLLPEVTRALAATQKEE